MPTLEDLLLYFVNLMLGIKLRIIVIYLIRSWVKVDTKDGVLGTLEDDTFDEEGLTWAKFGGFRNIFYHLKSISKRLYSWEES